MEFSGPHALLHFAEFLERQAAAAEVVEEAMVEATSHVLYDNTLKVFGDVSKLAELADATQEERTALGYTPNDPLLRDGKLLRDSVEREALPRIAAVGSSEEVMAYSEFGFVNHRTGKDVPARPVFEIGLADSEGEVMDILEAGAGATLGMKVSLTRLSGVREFTE